MNKNKNGLDIKLDISEKTVSFFNQNSGRGIKKELDDTLEIRDTVGEGFQKELYPLLGEIKGLFCLHIVSKTKKQDFVEIDYYGINGQRHSTYNNKYNQQVCLLLALLTAENHQLLIDPAYKILQDRERCRHNPNSGYASKDKQVYQVIKNIRKMVGFHHKELYFNSKSSIVGLRAF